MSAVHRVQSLEAVSSASATPPLAVFVLLTILAQAVVPAPLGIAADFAAAGIGMYLVRIPSAHRLAALALLSLPTLVFSGPSGAADWMVRAPSTTWLLPVFAVAAVVAGRAALRGRVERGAFLVVILFGLVASVAAARGYLEGLNAWSAPVRTALVLSAWLWGRVAARARPRTDDARALTLRSIIFAGALLIAAPWFFGHLRFQSIGLVAAALVAPLAWIPVRVRVLGAIGLAVSVRTGTDLGIAAVAAALFIWDRLIGERRSTIIAAVVAGAALVSLAVTATDAFGRVDMGSVRLPSGSTLEAKLFADRGPLWQSALRAIRSNGLDIPAAGGALDVEGVWLPWTGGAHNVLLQVGADAGLVATLLIASYYVIVLARAAHNPGSGQSTSRWVLFWGSMAALIVGSVFGQFPIQESGWFIWAAVGYATPVSERAAVADEKAH